MWLSFTFLNLWENICVHINHIFISLNISLPNILELFITVSLEYICSKSYKHITELATPWQHFIATKKSVFFKIFPAQDIIICSIHVIVQ